MYAKLDLLNSTKIKCRRAHSLVLTGILNNSFRRFCYLYFEKKAASSKISVYKRRKPLNSLFDFKINALKWSRQLCYPFDDLSVKTKTEQA